MNKHFFVLIFLFVSLNFVSTVSANPGFARKFGTSCAMCHSGFPSLNAFGETFRDNGFQMPGQDVGDKAVKTGDEKLFLEPSLNFAARVDGAISYRNDTNTHSDVGFPSLVKLFIFGYLKKDITFYTYFLADEDATIVGLEDAYLFFNNVGSHPFDFMLGQFQVTDFVYSRELRLTHQDITIYKTSVSSSNFDLTYHRGGAFMFSSEWFEIDLGLVNGNGIGLTDSKENFDNNSFKDPFLRLNFKKESLSLGFYGLYGEDQDKDTKFKNRFYRAGPDIRINRWLIPLDLKAQWLFGEDQNPDFLSDPGDSLKINGGFIEAVYYAGPEWIGVLMYNRVQVAQKPGLNANALTLNLTHYFLRNFKTYLEYTTDLEDKGFSHPEKIDNAQIVFVLAF
ncbi:MAG: hypothetical protein HY036_07730 [Nitrospirae bacterium]|nr:hypothetical protein [Nitrospirota bacterium]MBI3352454.1 hypothetical protein [Nitrospirota bacterium]